MCISTMRKPVAFHLSKVEMVTTMLSNAVISMIFMATPSAAEVG
jgi:hypothetical protein